MKHLQQQQGQAGQSLLLIAMGMVVFLAMIAVVIDSGNDYVQKRQLQNSTDAGAQAGAIKMAIGGSTNSDVNSAVYKYLVSNGTSTAGASAYYIVRDASGNNLTIRERTVLGYGGSNPVPTVLSVDGSSLPVVGVQVEAGRVFNTFFAGVVGFPQLNVSGGSAAYINRGACSADGVWPLTMNISTFMQNGQPNFHYADTEPTYRYNMYEKDQGSTFAPGNFGWLTWNGSPSAQTLQDNLWHPWNSGTLRIGQDIEGATGNMSSNAVRDAVAHFIDTTTPVKIPIFDNVSGTGANATYHIVGFAEFQPTGFDTQGNPKSMQGQFLHWVDSVDEGGCSNFGVTAIKLRPPISNTRNLIGAVKINKLTRVDQPGGSSHMPVDVMNVVDISGSMANSFGTGTKIQAVRSSLATFNSAMQTSLGDQVGLTVFPLNNGSGASSGQNYAYSCTQSGSTGNHYTGQLLSNLTNNVATVNGMLAGLNPAGYSSTGSGLSIARQAVLGSNHHGGNIPVLVLLSDGSANVRTIGEWTGYNNTGTPPTCNSDAENDAITQANFAKGDGNGDGAPDAVIYVIALGTDFDTHNLQAIATVDSDASRPHFFVAANASQLTTIYQQIASEIQSIRSDCTVISSEAFAQNATVSVRYPDGSTQNLNTGSIGEFVVPNAAPGTYQIAGATVTVNGLTYNLPTNGIGGSAIAWPINVQVGTSITTYKTEVDLKTAGTISCNY